MTDNFKETYQKIQRQAMRLTINKIWKMIKADNYDDLRPEELKLATIIMKHQEYQDYFENEEILDGSEFEMPSGTNPFLHISLHQMAEDQLASEKPVEAALLCEYIEKMGYSRHEAVHVIIMILIHMIFDAYKSQGSFDVERYKRLLVKCRMVKVPEMQGVVERDFFSN